MIGRTRIGGDFEGALSYGGGLGAHGARKKAELIGSANVGDVSDPRGVAAEMQAVASDNTRCKQPVWHTSLSWAEGERLTTAQKLQAAERYCELMGASWEAHQVAVYEHHDTKHEHIHIYLNRVPLAGGPALDTGHNYARNLKALRVITEEMGLNPLPSQRQSVQDHRPTVQETRTFVRSALTTALADRQVQSIEQLQEHLAMQGIEVRLKRSQAGELVGVSFRHGEAAVTGQEVGYKAAQLRAYYAPKQVVTQQADIVLPVPSAESGFTLAELPQDKLSMFGLDAVKLRANGQLQKMLNGEKTDLLTMLGGAQRDKPLVSFQGKLWLRRDEQGLVTLDFELPKKELLIPPQISGKPITPAQRQRLETAGTAGLMRGLKDAQGNIYNGYVGVDREMNTLVILPESKFTLPEEIAGVRLSLAQRDALREGLPVEIVGMKRADGSLFAGTMQVQAAKVGVELVTQKLGQESRQVPSPIQSASEVAQPLAMPPVSEQRFVVASITPLELPEDEAPTRKIRGPRR